MATEEYVDAGAAVPYATLSVQVGKAPPVTKGLTHERIINARDEPNNWLTYYGTYDGQRYSSLDQINKENVGKLTPQWVFQAGSMGLHSGASTYAWEASPIIVDGVMYVSGWDGQLWAIDAVNGKELWRYKHASPFDVSLCCGNVNRGVAVAENLVFMTTLNAHIIALDAETGKKVWDQTYGDVRAGESATVAPLVVKDMVIVGSSGGEFGSRGHTDAFKLATGERVWRCYMIPKPGEPGSETWPADSDAWQRGGANCWVTPTYDPELNLLYYGTGNPCPDFDGAVREGDNLYTDSGVAVDADTGEIKNHFQYTPHDLWDYDSTMEHILFDLDGQKLAAHFDKNGFLYILDRTNMDPVRVVPFVDRIDWGEVDDKGNVTPLRQTVLVLHDAERIGDPNATWGITDGNPIHDDVREIARMVGVDFAVDVTLNREQKLTDVFAGDLFVEHRAACEAAMRDAMRAVEAPFDVVLTTNSGFPLDQNLYQAVKGMSAAAKVVKPGGTIVWPPVESAVARVLGEVLASQPSPAKLLAMIRRRDTRVLTSGRCRFRRRCS